MTIFLGITYVLFAACVCAADPKMFGGFVWFTLLVATLAASAHFNAVPAIMVVP